MAAAACARWEEELVPKLRRISSRNPSNAPVQNDVTRHVTFGRKATFMRVGLMVATGGILALVCSGCGLLAHVLGGGPAQDTRRRVDATIGGQPINQAELDELTRGFADRYVGLLSSACDALKKDNPDLVQRREAQVLLADCATNVYDIASNPDAFTRLLDLLVVTTLVSQVWIDDNRVEEVFADRQEVLVRALHHGRVEVWALAAQVLRPDQLDLLDYLLWDWRRHNTDMVRSSFVRFSNFAIGRGRTAQATVESPDWFSVVEVLGVGDLFSSVGQTGRAVDEARLLSERIFYFLKRGPTLLRWQVDALQDEMLATPEVAKTLANMHRLTDQAEQLPKNVAAERQAILAAFDDRMHRADATVTNMRAAMSEANGLVTSLGPTSKSLNEMLKTADALVARFDRPDRGTATQPSRPFDIREYTEAVKELAVTAGKMNDLLGSSEDLLGSSEWDRRIQQMSQSADVRMKMAAQQSQRVVQDFFRRTYVALGVLCAILILCFVVVFLLRWRLRAVAGDAGKPGQGSGGEAGHEIRSETNARGAGGKGMSE
jgi:hypothetical protein